MAIDLTYFIEHLPLNSEEGGFYTTVSRELLMQKLSASQNQEVGNSQLQLLERLLDGLSLLDSESLANGHWRFVSFPASLMARSLLQALSDGDSRFLEKSFWLADQPDPIQIQQRQILHELETRRVQLHREQAAKPIRYVHVAWAFIKIDGRILLHHREDKSRLDVANYVPIGGKLHLCDFDESFSQSEALAFLQNPADTAVFQALPMTLKREVLEEVGLRYREHYQFSEWKTLPCYRKVEGAGSRHAYTEYQIVIYQLQLTLSGLLVLMQNIQNSTTLIWFTPEELAQGYRADGKKAFVDALQTAWQSKQDDLTAELAGLADSYQDNALDPATTQPVTLPMTHSMLMIGKTGSEKEYRLELTAEERLLLLGLGWHRRDLAWTDLPEGVSAVAYGWLIITEPDLNTKLLALAEKLVDVGLPLIACVDGVGFRLNVQSDNVFFDDGLFQIRFNPQTQSTGILLEIAALITPLGSLKAMASFIPLSAKLTRELAQVAKGPVYQAENPNLPGLVRREIEKITQQFGLRKVMRQDNGKFELTVSALEIKDME